ncbi:hypothetical protein LTR62_000400 [Meristemomyces frigidus]|uniref:Lytic polysaccharide monooxygenase n=1 Tax=Meristemomyces frigidus TaxID=1508187 RepID=A0AAN7TMM2_9PEZI|nr:hypothetical protein LTR62_000400 [Meristemomyces frigidus]
MALLTDNDRYYFWQVITYHKQSQHQSTAATAPKSPLPVNSNSQNFQLHTINMGFHTLSLAALVGSAALFGGVNAHIKIMTPTPFGNSTLDTSPLNNAAIGSSASNFPCKQRSGVYDIAERTPIAVGADQPLIFSGSASHGGGVCQLAMTTDAEPTANSIFKLFTVIEGCPIKDDSTSGGISDYSFKLPQGTPNGNLTLAWIWYNRIGNREIYMNCMPVEVTGGSDDKTAYEAMNNAYIINQPTEDCSSQEMGDTIIPNPGNAVVQKFNPTSQLSASGTGCAALAAAMTKGVSGGGAAGGSASAPSSAAATLTTVSSSPAGSYAPSSMTSAAAISASSASSSMTTTSIAAITSSAPAYSHASSSTMAAAAPSYAPLAGTNSTSSTNTTSPDSGSSSSSSDGITCAANGTQFCQVTAGGKKICRPVAAGTQCSNGQIVKRSMSRHPHVRRYV